ncbi:hypothetical protein [Nesterenkonia suensis]
MYPPRRSASGPSDRSGERIITAEGQLDAVRRELEVHPGDDGVTVTTRLSQTFPVGPEELWECVTRADRLAQWFGSVTGELHLGGRFAVQDNASGAVERCVPPQGGGSGEMQLSWEFGEDVSQVLLHSEPAEPKFPHAVGHATKLRVEHRGMVPQAFWVTYGPGAGGVGWDLALLGLGHHLRTGSTVPGEQTLWVTTPAAAEFIAGSSAAWGRASHAAGTPVDQAEAAARRTTEFYTTPERGLSSMGSPDIRPVGDLPDSIGRTAVRELSHHGIRSLAQAAAHTPKELLAIHGVGPKVIRLLTEALAENGLSWRDEE